MNFKEKIKKNWDVYILIGLLGSIFLFYLALELCTADVSCLGYIIPILISFQVTMPFFVIAIIRNIRNKTLGHWRWIVIGIIVILYIYVFLADFRVYNPLIWFK